MTRATNNSWIEKWPFHSYTVNFNHFIILYHWNIVYILNSYREGEREKKIDLHLLVHSPATMVRIWPVKSQDSGASSKSPTLAMGSNIWIIASPGPLAGSWIRCGADRIWSATSMSFWHPKWRLYSPCRSCPSITLLNIDLTKIENRLLQNCICSINNTHINFFLLFLCYVF